MLTQVECSLGVARLDRTCALRNLLGNLSAPFERVTNVASPSSPPPSLTLSPSSMSLVSTSVAITAPAALHSLRLERNSLVDRHLSSLAAFIEHAPIALRELAVAGNAFSLNAFRAFERECVCVRATPLTIAI